MPPNDPRSPCPVVLALDTFGDRWTLLVIRDMAMRGFSTYGEFLKAGESISTNILADRLKKLEEQGVVVMATGRSTVAEEMPEAYKDVSDVVDVVAAAGICRKVAQLRPLGVIKG